MEVEVDAEAVFAAPLDGSQEIAPADFRDVWIIVVGRNRPVGVRDSDVVDSGGLDVG